MEKLIKIFARQFEFPSINSKDFLRNLQNNCFALNKLTLNENIKQSLEWS